MCVRPGSEAGRQKTIILGRLRRCRAGSPKRL